MTNADWRPLGVAADEHAALHEGMTPWLEESFWQWVRYRFTRRTSTGGSFSRPTSVVTSFRTDLLRDFERTCRMRVEFTGTSLVDGMKLLRHRVSAAEAEFRLADFLVKAASDKAAKADLDAMLEEAGAAWRIGTRDGHPGLERRVPEGVQEAADRAMATPGHAGARLSEAWQAVYGLSPNPTHGYAMAVKVVEDAAVPVVVPKQVGATLGHVIGQLRNDGDWALPLTREDAAAPTPETVLRLCQGLWKGHHDRHGGDASALPAVGQDEAESAVQIAVFLVHGFATGMIGRRALPSGAPAVPVEKP